MRSKSRRQRAIQKKNQVLDQLRDFKSSTLKTEPLAPKGMTALEVSELRYRRMFETAQDGMLLLNPGTRKITHANAYIADFLGCPREQLAGRELLELGLVGDPAASRKLFRELRQHRFIRYEVSPLKSRGGFACDVEVSASLYDENGKAVIQCNVRDITERNAVTTALRASEERFRILFDVGPVAVYSCGVDGIIQEFNQRSAELWGRKPKLGVSEEKFCGAHKLHRADGTFVPHDQSPMAAVLAGKLSRVQDLEVIVQRPDKTRITVIANIVPLKNGRGEITGAINCFYDITERKQAESALQKVKDKIARHAVDLEQLVTQRTNDLLKTIGELEAFSYSISHDMRAPLRAMRGFAEILLEDHSSQLDAEGSRYLERIRNAAGRMDSLIHDVLTYAHVLHAEVKIEPIDLHLLVREIIDTYPQLHRADVEIQIEGRLPKILGAETILIQCVSNLLTNAVKFVAPKTRPRIKIRSEIIAPYIKLWVEDNGIGIAPKDQSRILNLFERVDSANSYEGTGVGLTIVRKAVEKMGGQMGIESKVNEGSKFWIQLKQAG